MMGTTTRPELSEKNKYWIERHRYYELKHFCLQYPMWKKAYVELNDAPLKPSELAEFYKTGGISDPTFNCAVKMLFYSEKIKMIEQAAKETNSDFEHYILKAVTTGVSYDYLKSKLDIPCCKDTYYELYRRFFWLLNKARN